jgi:hypothetical protein
MYPQRAATTMSDQQAELLKSFRAFIQAAEDGVPIPPVEGSPRIVRGQSQTLLREGWSDQHRDDRPGM